MQSAQMIRSHSHVIAGMRRPISRPAALPLHYNPYFSSDGTPFRLQLGLFARWWGRKHSCSERHQIWLPFNGWFEQHGDSWEFLVLASQDRHAECSRRACSQ